MNLVHIPAPFVHINSLNLIITYLVCPKIVQTETDLKQVSTTLSMLLTLSGT